MASTTLEHLETLASGSEHGVPTRRMLVIVNPPPPPGGWPGACCC